MKALGAMTRREECVDPRLPVAAWTRRTRDLPLEAPLPRDSVRRDCRGLLPLQLTDVQHAERLEVLSDVDLPGQVRVSPALAAVGACQCHWAVLEFSECIHTISLLADHVAQLRRTELTVARQRAVATLRARTAHIKLGMLTANGE